MSVQDQINRIFGKTEAAPLPAQNEQTEAAPLTIDRFEQVLAKQQEQTAEIIAQVVASVLQHYNQTEAAPLPAPGADQTSGKTLSGAAPAQTEAAPSRPARQLTNEQTERLQTEASKGSKFVGWLPTNGPDSDYPVFSKTGANGQTYVRFVKPTGAAPLVSKQDKKRIITEAAQTSGKTLSGAAPAQTEAEAAPTSGKTLSGAAPVSQTYVCENSHKRRDRHNYGAAYMIKLVNTTDGKTAQTSNGAAIFDRVCSFVKSEIVTPKLYNGFIHVEADRSFCWVYLGAAHERHLFNLNAPLDKKIRSIASVLNTENNR